MTAHPFSCGRHHLISTLQPYKTYLSSLDLRNDQKALRISKTSRNTAAMKPKETEEKSGNTGNTNTVGKTDEVSKTDETVKTVETGKTGESKTAKSGGAKKSVAPTSSRQALKDKNQQELVDEAELAQPVRTRAQRAASQSAAAQKKTVADRVATPLKQKQQKAGTAMSETPEVEVMTVDSDPKDESDEEEQTPMVLTARNTLVGHILQQIIDCEEISLDEVMIEVESIGENPKIRVDESLMRLAGEALAFACEHSGTTERESWAHLKMLITMIVTRYDGNTAKRVKAWYGIDHFSAEKAMKGP
jgi:hypothetical protein